MARLVLIGSAALVAAAVAATAALSMGRAAGSSLPLKEVARVSLPGRPVRFDYQSYDPSRHRLYIAHMDADELLVFDTRSRKVIKRIPAPGVHGVIAAAGRVYLSATNDRQAYTIDAKTLKVTAKADAGQYPDGLAYDPVKKHVFVSDENGGIETVLDQRGRKITEISLGGEAGNVQYDAGSNRMLVGVQTRNELAFINPGFNEIVHRIKLDGCDGSHGVLVDSPRRLAFVACVGNAKLVTVDLRRMKQTAITDVGDGPDVLAFDPGLRRLYVSAESGDVAVFAEQGRSLRKLGQAHLADAAHTVAVDPKTHLVYFPLQSGSNGTPQLLIMRPT
jgi:DNA-binding beta-propeller fold protein YncE